MFAFLGLEDTREITRGEINIYWRIDLVIFGGKVAGFVDNTN